MRVQKPSTIRGDLKLTLHFKKGRKHWVKRWQTDLPPGPQRAEDINPRAKGTNPRAMGTNPRALR